MNDFEIMIENLSQHLSSDRQAWLFGAGISCDANIPLMYQLTYRVKDIIEKSNDINKEIYKLLSDDLDKAAHIEHYLSHLGDLIALAGRSKNKSALIGNKNFQEKDLCFLHSEIVKAIGTTVRYGYRKSDDKEDIGTLDNSIIDISLHRKFIKALFQTRENLKSRSNITFFTTNYDTLFEDAMALEKSVVIDGFSGGAMGIWNPKEFETRTIPPNQYHFYKLHGSVDWYKNNEFGLVRARYGTKYLSNLSEIMIYPQATKYVETQKDPFASLFAQLRTVINSDEPNNVFITCGYSFGDDHINSEIEAALKLPSNKINIIAFFKENPEGDIVINKTLDSWLQNTQFGKRIFVAGENGLYNNSLTPVGLNKKFNWWKFSGLTEFLKTGEAE
jgi:hypothetical protein